MQIYWVEMRFLKEVHAQALGFTKWFSKYVYANAPEEAEAAVKLWAESKEIELDRVLSCRLAKIQDYTTYTFIEQIINLPNAMLQAEYDRRGYPPSFRSPGQSFPIH